MFGAAYMAPPMPKNFAQAETETGTFSSKAAGYIALLRSMLTSSIALRVREASSLRQVYDLLRGFPGIGDFMAYQLATDLNYSEVIDFDENSFTRAGPGAVRGVAKCFEDTGERSPEEIIMWLVERQAEAMVDLDINPEQVWLPGRRFRAIDCQNLFCETDKYCRVAFPEISSGGAASQQRGEIKQRFKLDKPRQPLPEPYYPPKWEVPTDAVLERGRQHRQLCMAGPERAPGSPHA